MSKQKLSLEQKAQIYCIKNGHANYVWRFWGYVYCGRCGTQLGDQLASVFDTRDMIVVGHKCKKCSLLKKKLNPMDKEILKRLEKDKKAISYNYEKILQGIKLK